MRKAQIASIDLNRRKQVLGLPPPRSPAGPLAGQEWVLFEALGIGVEAGCADPTNLPPAAGVRARAHLHAMPERSSSWGGVRLLAELP